MARKNVNAKPLNIEVFLGGTPLLEPRIIEGLLAFGKSRPNWRFTMRGPDYRYRAEGLKRQKPDGVIVSINHTAVSKRLDAAGIPWVCLLPNAAVSATYVTTDNPAIGKLAANYYLEKGFRHFAVCGLDAPWSEERKTAFVKTLADAGQTCRDLNVDYQSGPVWEFPARRSRQVAKWLSSLTLKTALFTTHDSLASRLVDLCVRQSIRIPQQVSILSVGDHDLFCQLSPVTISSINANVPKLAETSAVLLEQCIQKKKNVKPVILPPRGITERRSTMIVAYDDELIADIVSHIRENACNGLTVASLTKTFPIARRTLLRRFRQIVGRSPVEEIARVRFASARNLLTQTNWPLTQIAVSCGYSDLAHFCRVFRKAEGVTPAALRKRIC